MQQEVAISILETNLLGKGQPQQLAPTPDGYLFHPMALVSFLELQRKASDAGFDLRVASSFRSYDAQLKIWNEKVQGTRKVLDDQDLPIDINLLSPEQIIFAILRFSAIPGFSRHHWGTDFDYFDANKIKRHELKLIRSEYENGGACAELNQWLSDLMLQNESCGFFRPYDKDHGGVSPEPWHLSFLPAATSFEKALTEDFFKRHLPKGDALLKEQLLVHAPVIYRQYIEANFLKDRKPAIV